MKDPAKRIYLIDGSGYMFRAYYAMIRQRLSNSKGMPTGAVLTFARMLLKVIREKAPEYIAVVFDTPAPTFRHEIYPAYKGNRDAPPEDMVVQIPYMQRVVEVLRIPALSREGAEADDIIGTLAEKAAAEDFEVILVTADKDFMQLVTERISMWDPMKDITLGPAEVEARWGVPPEKVVEVQALMGDSSDNVPGVPGIGEKTAISLIQEFGGLEAVLASAEKIKRPKQRQNIEENADLARLSLDLCTIRRDIPVDGNLENYRLQAADMEAARRLFVEELEIKNILSQLPGYEGAEKKTTEAEAAEAAGGLSGLLGAARERDYRLVRTQKELAALQKALGAADRISLDLETTSLNAMIAEIVGFNFSVSPGQAWYVPVGHTGIESGPQLPSEKVLEAVRPALTSPKKEKIGQNIKYDIEVLARAGLKVQEPVFDTMVASYLLHSDRQSHGLDHLADAFLGLQTIKYADLCGKGAKQIPFAEVPAETAALYGCQDADFTLRLADKMAPELEKVGLASLFRELEMPLLDVLREMEMTGIRLDGDFLGEMSKDLEARLDEMQKKIHDLAGEEFNINSTLQLRKILFEKLNLPVVKKTKTGPSTDLDTLERLAPQHPLPEEIVNFRQLSKLKSTYVDTLPALVHPQTGRIHAKFNQTVAATGRLSSSDPNLQNIPVRTELGRRIRRAFLPEEGWKLLSVDYSQIELRVLAHFTGDPGLVGAFERGEDIHATTASAVYGVSPADVTGEMRRVAKAVNFGIVYGQRAFGLAQTVGIGFDEARVFIETYFQRFAKVPAFVDEVIAEATERGYVSTILDRRRYIPDLKSQNRNIRSAAERTAVNSVIQGSAADIIKKAMVAIAARLRKEKRKARLLVQVHDELLFETPPKELKAVTQLVEEEMARAFPLRVPLAAKANVGDNWGEVD
ncbi:MAG: DNA polymerase I [bacterium]|nr:DNA polymerase I [bacterium]